MSLKPQAIGPIPQPTIEVAKAAFPKGNTYITMRDEMGVFLMNRLFIFFPSEIHTLNGNCCA